MLTYIIAKFIGEYKLFFSLSYRFVDNFSAGTRGAASAEEFIANGFAVVFLSREKSVQPFERHINSDLLFNCVRENEGGICLAGEGWLKVSKFFFTYISEFRFKSYAYMKKKLSIKKSESEYLLTFPILLSNESANRYLWYQSKLGTLILARLQRAGSNH